MQSWILVTFLEIAEALVEPQIIFEVGRPGAATLQKMIPLELPSGVGLGEGFHFFLWPATWENALPDGERAGAPFAETVDVRASKLADKIERK